MGQQVLHGDAVAVAAGELGDEFAHSVIEPDLAAVGQNHQARGSHGLRYGSEQEDAVRLESGNTLAALAHQQSGLGDFSRRGLGGNQRQRLLRLCVVGPGGHSSHQQLAASHVLQ